MTTGIVLAPGARPSARDRCLLGARFGGQTHLVLRKEVTLTFTADYGAAASASRDADAPDMKEALRELSSNG